MEAKTRVVIYGLAGTLREDRENGTVDDNTDSEELQKSVQAACCREMKREDSMWQTIISIEGSPVEGGFCEDCGSGCGHEPSG